jgi:hypothetical protein
MRKDEIAVLRQLLQIADHNLQAADKQFDKMSTTEGPAAEWMQFTGLAVQQIRNAVAKIVEDL